MLLPVEKRKFKLYEKIKSKTAEFERDIKDLINNGIVIIDKPAGPTSHNVSHYVKEIFGLKKAGHSGTLDPMVTGVLPVALGDATKINFALLNTGKEYVCVMHIHRDISENDVKNELKKIIGKIKQTPPVKSAVKREEREREIYYIEFLEMKGRDILFIIGCEGGTYIRKICSDFGEMTGWGAHMKELRRTKAGPFKEEDCVTLNGLQDSVIEYKKGSKDAEKKLKKIILPIEFAVKHIPKYYCKEEVEKHIKNGRNLLSKDVVKFEDGKVGELAAVMSANGRLLALGNVVSESEDIMTEKKYIAVDVERVF